MKVDQDGLKGFAVQPKLDCPHLTSQLATNINGFLASLPKTIAELQCQVCQDQNQNWVCLICHQIHCSRYVKGHMAQHNEDSKHSIALSLTDGSYWCYNCDSYIDSYHLRPARTTLSNIKINEEKPTEEKASQEKPIEISPQEKEREEYAKQEEVNKLEALFKVLGLNNEKPLKVTFSEVIDGLRQKKYKKVVVLTGAGLSVAAGIPDFRSPGTGLYSKLQEYKLPYPQAIFSIDYFKDHPTAFLTLAKELLTKDFEPTLGHKFIKRLQDEGILLMNMTQNIDDLQIKAGVHQDKLLQAHGHSRSAHCLGCKKQASIEQWKKLASKCEPMICECGEYVKPDIVFFGEQLPASFFAAPKLIDECDLAIIIGTSLKVMPFAYLAQLIPQKAPVLLINREDVLESRQNRIWMAGDIQQNVQKIMSKLDWL